jgi:hypothetical protein
MPAIIFFKVMLLLILIDPVSDLLKIPRSKFAPAKVISKERRGGSASRIQVYQMVFEFEDRKAVTLAVSAKTYDSLSFGSKGVLEYIDGRCRKFHVNKTLAEIVNPDKKPRDFREGFKKIK